MADKELDLLLAEILEMSGGADVSLTVEDTKQYAEDSGLSIDELLEQLDLLAAGTTLDTGQRYPAVSEEAREPQPDTLPFALEEFVGEAGMERTGKEAEEPDAQSIIFENIPETADSKDLKKGGAARIASNVVFYAVLALTVLGAIILTSNDSKPRSIFGYSYFSVTTTSMQSEIPKGSLIITKSVDPADIQINDDITFWVSETQTVTHRVIEIYEDYAGSGQRGFKTKGIENSAADNGIVAAGDVVGVVRVTVPKVGAVLSYIKSKLWLVAAALFLLVILSLCTKIFFSRKSKPGIDDTKEKSLFEP